MVEEKNENDTLLFTHHWQQVIHKEGKKTVN